MHRKAQIVAKITALQKDHSLLILLCNFSKYFMFAYETNIMPSNNDKIFEK